MITLNDRLVTYEDGQTILEVAQANGLHIPTLCHLQGTQPTGACRICLVEIEGAKDLITSCNTKAHDGMVIQTHSRRVIAARKGILELLMNSGDHNCFNCNVNGRCELQDLALEYGVDNRSLHHPRFDYGIIDDNELITRDATKCIHCGRCVKACNEVQVNNVLNFGMDGRRPLIFAGDNETLAHSDCVFCGQCVQACPTGALTERKHLHEGHLRDEKKIRTTCPYCGVGCQLWLHLRDDKIVRVTGVEDGLPNKGRTCIKGRFAYDFIHSRKRLTKPLIKDGEGYREAEWGEALDLIAEKFGGFIAESGPDSVAGISCARSVNEDNYQMQKLFRSVFGTNNIDHCART
jgi:formate dehydrogenase major subunit